MRKIIQNIIIVIGGLSVLSGCTQSKSNMQDAEIVQQIQTKIKEEMKRIEFDVDFADYDFGVNTTQTQGSVGTVTLKDKRYGGDPITIYKGSFQSIEQDKIGMNPLMFIYRGYIAYVDEVNQAQNQVIQKYLDQENIKYTCMPFREKDFVGARTLPFSLEIKSGQAQTNNEQRSELFLWETVKPTDAEYIKSYKGRNTKTFSYNEFDKEISKGSRYYYAITNKEDISVLQSTMQSLVSDQRYFVEAGKIRGI